MRTQIRLLAAAVVLSTACSSSIHAVAADSSEPVRKALENLQTWLGSGTEGWSAFLKLPVLEAELAKGEAADPAALAPVIKQLESGAKGLELERFVALRDAVTNWSEDLTIAKAPGLSEAVIASEPNFVPVTAAQVVADKAALVAVAAKLDAFLAKSGANGKGWREYLQWKDLDAQLKSDTPDVEVLKGVQHKFSADQKGLELPVYAAVGKALRHYLNDLAASQPEAQAEYVTQLKGLAEELTLYAKEQSEELALAIGGRLGWLTNMRQAKALVRAIRSRYSRPNLFAAISKRLVAVGIEQPVDEITPVSDNILGTSISGKGHTVGKLTMKLVPSEDRAIIETNLVGRVTTQTVGFNGPATIHSDGNTTIQGAKRIVITSDGFASYPATATAAMTTNIRGVSANSNLVQRIATRKVHEARGEAEQIGSAHAAQRVRERLEAQAGQQLGNSQYSFNQKFRDPLVRRGEFPELLRFRTTSDALYVMAMQANSLQLGAPSEPPKVEGEYDLVARVHESMFNNVAASMLAGITLTEEQVKEKVIEMRGSLPDQLKNDEDRDPWSITFAKARPVTVKLGDDAFQITVRGHSYTSGERVFKAMNVTANYKMEIKDNVSHLVRQGELEILPPGFIPGKSKLSVQQTSWKTVLARKFGRLFEPEIKGEGLELPGRWKEAGKLDMKHLKSGAGWVAMAWLQNTQPANRVASDKQGKKE